jgi:hypothetical protein
MSINNQTNLQNDSTNNICTKIYSHFQQKYPETLGASGIQYSSIYQIVNYYVEKRQMNSTTIPKIIATLDSKIKQKIHSRNRNTEPLQTSQHKTDTQVHINIDKYLNNFSPIVNLDDINSMSNQNSNQASTKLFNNDKVINKMEDERQHILQNLQFNQAKVEKIDSADKIREISEDENNPYSENFPLRNREKDSDMLSPETKEFDYYIMIDSKDRNTEKNPAPNDFVIEFSPSSGADSPSNGYIDRGLGNIVSIELMDVVILDTSELSDSSDAGETSYPYLLLNIDELGGNYFGTNNNISRSFSILKNYNKVDSYRYYSMLGDTSDMSTKKVFNPRINLTRMTIQIQKPDGTLFDFGASSSSTSNTVVNISMRVTTLQKNLATQFSNKATF